MSVNIGTIEGVLRLRDEFTAVLNKAAGQMAGSAAKLEQLGAKLTTAGVGLTTALTAPLAAVGGLSVKAASDFESSFAGVRKTVDATSERFAELSHNMRAMAKEIPVNVNELNNIAAAAGQLGIETAAIEEFTRTIAAMGVATNLTTDAAATAMARLANITQMPQSQFENLGSAIVNLGNNLATTEAEIVEFGLRIAGAGEIAGLSEGQILGIGAAMSSVGVEAEAGGTAVQKVLLNMVQAVAQGGEQLNTFAATAGMSASEFKRAFQEDAGKAFEEFVEGLGRAGDKAFDILSALGMEDQRLIRGFLSLANAGDLLAQSMEYGTRGFQENLALAREAGERYKTFASQLTLTKNALMDAAQTFGEAMLPVLRDFLESLKPVIEFLASLAEAFGRFPKPIQAAIIAMAAFAAALGPVLIIAGQLTSGLGALAALAPKLAVAFTGMAGPLGVLAAALAAASLALAAYSAQAEKDIAKLVEQANAAGTAMERLKRAREGLKATEAEYMATVGQLSAKQQEASQLEDRIAALREQQAVRRTGQRNIEIAAAERALQTTRNEINVLSQAQAAMITLGLATEGAAEAAGDDGLAGAFDAASEAMKSAAQEATRARQVLELLGRGIPAEDVERLAAAAAALGETNLMAPDVQAMAEHLLLIEQAAEAIDKAKTRAEAMREAMKKTADEGKRFGAALVKELEKGLSKVRELKDTVKTSTSLTKVTDFDRGWDAAGEAVRDLIAQEEILKGAQQRINAEYAAGNLKLIEAVLLHRQMGTEIGQKIDDIGKAASIVADELRDIDKPWARAGAALADMVTNLANAKTEAEAFAAIIKGLADALIAMGVGIEETAGGFGGRGEGNRAQEGQAIGAIIGAIIGGIYGGMQGAQAGAQIGGAIGQLVGSFVKRGADEALAKLEFSSGDLAASVSKSERSLGHVLGDLAENIDMAIDQILAALGATLTKIPKVTMKVRDGVISVWVGEIVGRFKAMEEAVSFAVAEILKQGDIVGLSDTIRTVLENTGAETMEQLAADLDFGMWYDTIGLSEAGQRFQEQLVDFRQKLAKAIELGLDVGPVIEWGKEQFADLRKELLGIGDGAAEALAGLRSYQLGASETRAEIEKNIADLASQIAGLDTAMKLAQEAIGGTAAQTRDQVSGMFKSKEELEKAMQSYLAQLDALPEALSDAELDMGIFDALYRYLEGNQKYEAQRVEYARLKVALEFEAIRAQLELLGRFEQFAAMFNDAYAAAMQAAGRPIGGGSGRADERDSVRDFIKDRTFELSLTGLNEYQRALAELDRQYAELLKQAGKDIALRGELIALKEEELRQLRAEHVERAKDTFKDYIRRDNPFRDLRKEAEEVVKAIQESPIGDAQKARMIARVWNEMADRIAALADEMTSSLFGQLASDLERLGAGEWEALELRRYAAILEHQLKMDHYQREFDMLKALGRMTPAMEDAFNRALAAFQNYNPAQGGHKPPELPGDMGVPGPPTLINGHWWKWDGTQWIYLRPDKQAAPPTTGGGFSSREEYWRQFAERLRRATDALRRYQQDGLDPLTRRLVDITADFREIRAGLGDTVEVMTAYAQAVSRAFEEFLAPIEEVRRELFYGELSPFDTMAKWGRIQSELADVQARWTSGDLNVVGELPDFIRQYMELARQVAPIGSAAYATIAEQIDAFLRDVGSLSPADLGSLNNPMSVAGISDVVMLNQAQLNVLDQIERTNGRVAAATEAMALKLSYSAPTHAGVN